MTIKRRKAHSLSFFPTLLFHCPFCPFHLVSLSLFHVILLLWLHHFSSEVRTMWDSSEKCFLLTCPHTLSFTHQALSMAESFCFVFAHLCASSHFSFTTTAQGLKPPRGAGSQHTPALAQCQPGWGGAGPTRFSMGEGAGWTRAQGGVPTDSVQTWFYLRSSKRRRGE